MRASGTGIEAGTLHKSFLDIRRCYKQNFLCTITYGASEFRIETERGFSEYLLIAGDRRELAAKTVTKTRAPPQRPYLLK